MYAELFPSRPDTGTARVRPSEGELHCEVDAVNCLSLQDVGYVRLGEWLLIPQPDLEIPFDRVEHNGELRRSEGKRHRVEWLYCTNDPGRRTYALGHVTHGDDATIKLDVWHRVVMNTEATPLARLSSATLSRRARPRIRTSCVG